LPVVQPIPLKTRASGLSGTTEDLFQEGQSTWKDREKQRRETMSDLKDKAKEKIDRAADAANRAAEKVVDTSKEVSHSAGKKLEEGGSGSRTRDEFNTSLMQMKPFKLVLPILITMAVFGYGQAPDPNVPKPDNTKVNKRDRNAGEVTADQQKVNSLDRELTRKIRRSLMADKSLSTYAHNIKIISQNGTVTLKGPVKSDEEKATVVAKAVAVAGSADKVTDQISVKH
jgi:hyperosmotically inducible protein